MNSIRLPPPARRALRRAARRGRRRAAAPHAVPVRRRARRAGRAQPAHGPRCRSRLRGPTREFRADLRAMLVAAAEREGIGSAAEAPAPTGDRHRRRPSVTRAPVAAISRGQPRPRRDHRRQSPPARWPSPASSVASEDADARRRAVRREALHRTAAARARRLGHQPRPALPGVRPDPADRGAAVSGPARFRRGARRHGRRDPPGSEAADHRRGRTGRIRPRWTRSDAFVRAQQRAPAPLLDKVQRRLAEPGAQLARPAGTDGRPRSEQLRETLTCGITASDGSDALGPRPGSCSTGSGPTPPRAGPAGPGQPDPTRGAGSGKADHKPEPGPSKPTATASPAGSGERASPQAAARRRRRAPHRTRMAACSAASAGSSATCSAADRADALSVRIRAAWSPHTRHGAQASGRS